MSPILALVPNLTPDNLTTLRSGRRLVQKEVTLHFSFKIKDVDGVWVTKQGRVDVIAKDIAEVNTFFGDRPLKSPGYSKRVGTISDSVIVRTKGTPIPPITLALIGATRSMKKAIARRRCVSGKSLPPLMQTVITSSPPLIFSRPLQMLLKFNQRVGWAEARSPT